MKKKRSNPKIQRAGAKISFRGCFFLPAADLERSASKPAKSDLMSNTGICRLCQTPNAVLRASHIVPEFFYKRIYTRTHKFTAISKDPDERVSVDQKGYREYLLCQACETKLSKWERKLSLLTNEVTSENYVTHTAMKVSNVTCITGIDYPAIKMGVLSIFWRMGIASHPLFSIYKLGPYSEVLRKLLDQSVVPAEAEFPVLLSRGLLDGSFHAGILFPVGQGRYENNLIIQSVVLNGIVFDCFMTNTRRIPGEVLKFAINSSGRVLMPNRPYEQLGLDVGEFSARMKKVDVKSFYARHA